MAHFRTFVRVKVQRLVVTDKSLNYEGSLELDESILLAADLLPGEVVQVVNVNNGARFETYVITGKPGSGACVLNGGAARLGEVGDELIVMANVLVEESEAPVHQVKRVFVNRENRAINDSGRPGSR